MKKLSVLGYQVTRQKGSHGRLTFKDENGEHHITIPDHDPIKIGLLSRILSDVAQHLNISKGELHSKINK